MEMIKKGADPLDAVIAGVAIVEADPNDHSVGLGGTPNEEGRRRARRLGHARPDPRRRGRRRPAQHRAPGGRRPDHHEEDPARPARRRQRPEIRQGARLPRGGPHHRGDPQGLDRLEGGAAPRQPVRRPAGPARPGRPRPRREAGPRHDPLLGDRHPRRHRVRHDHLGPGLQGPRPRRRLADPGRRASTWTTPSARAARSAWARSTCSTAPRTSWSRTSAAA